ncbi:MAG: MmgE/PrpD family protein [Hydrogenophaga sp.]
MDLVHHKDSEKIIHIVDKSDVSTPVSERSGTSAGATQRLARFSTRLDPASLRDSDLAACGRTWLDTVGVAVPGWREPAARRALAYAAQLEGLEPGPKRARLWGHPGASSMEMAAFLNGVAAHVLDYDDVTSPMRGHPSVALWPALMALADGRGLSGARLPSAYIVGFEAICKLSKAIAQPHYARGWHTTSSIGVIGATLACCHLLELDLWQTSNALGLAVAQSGGTRQHFGTDAKSFQAGMCGAAAVRSALLAEQGLDASESALDGPFGFTALHGNGESLADALSALGESPFELHTSGVEVKRFPMCYATHRAIDGVLSLRRDHGLTLRDVRRVDVETSAGGLIPLIHHRPGTGLQAKFSMEYAVAAALADAGVRLSSFTDEAVRRPEIVDFMARVNATECQGALFPRFSLVRLELVSGDVLERRVEVQHGAAADPLTDDELIEKVADCLSLGGCGADPRKLLHLASGMRRHSAAVLLDSLM